MKFDVHGFRGSEEINLGIILVLVTFLFVLILFEVALLFLVLF